MKKIKGSTNNHYNKKRLTRRQRIQNFKKTEDENFKEGKKRKVKKNSDSKTCNCWENYERVPGTEPCEPNSCKKKGSSDFKEGETKQQQQKRHNRKRRNRSTYNYVSDPSTKGANLRGAERRKRKDDKKRNRKVKRRINRLKRKKVYDNVKKVVRKVGDAVNKRFKTNFSEGKITKSNKPGKKWKKKVGGKTYHGGDSNYSISPGTSRGDSYCARSYGIKKKHGSTPKNEMARKKWKCKGKKSMK